MVEYFSMPEVPGRTFFRCEVHRATLSKDACANNWRQANHEGSEQRSSCRLCPIGAEHAGEADASMSPLKGTNTCARCHRFADRLIGAHVCVSCKNREYELVRGRNAKGSKPVNLAPLQPRRVTYLEGDQPRVLVRQLTVDTDELLVAVLRDAKHRVRFAFSGQGARLPQLSLF